MDRDLSKLRDLIEAAVVESGYPTHLRWEFKLEDRRGLVASIRGDAGRPPAEGAVTVSSDGEDPASS